jgi:hypothetical protein
MSDVEYEYEYEEDGACEDAEMDAQDEAGGSARPPVAETPSAAGSATAASAAADAVPPPATAAATSALPRPSPSSVLPERHMLGGLRLSMGGAAAAAASAPRSSTGASTVPWRTVPNQQLREEMEHEVLGACRAAARQMWTRPVCGLQVECASGL